jgi:hypothetical protein
LGARHEKNNPSSQSSTRDGTRSQGDVSLGPLSNSETERPTKQPLRPQRERPHSRQARDEGPAQARLPKMATGRDNDHNNTYHGTNHEAKQNVVANCTRVQGASAQVTRDTTADCTLDCCDSHPLCPSQPPRACARRGV